MESTETFRPERPSGGDHRGTVDPVEQMRAVLGEIADARRETTGMKAHTQGIDRLHEAEVPGRDLGLDREIELAEPPVPAPVAKHWSDTGGHGHADDDNAGSFRRRLPATSWVSGRALDGNCDPDS